MSDEDELLGKKTAVAAHEFLNELIKSEKRIQILDCLVQKDPMINKEVAKTVDCAPSLVSKVADLLSAHHLLKDERELELTPAGESVLEPLVDSVWNINVVSRLELFLSEVSDYGAAQVEEIIHALEGAEIDDQNRNAAPPVKGYSSLIGEANTVKELVPFRLNEGDAFLGKFGSDELSGTFIIDSTIVPDIMDVDKSKETFQNLRRAGAGMKEAEGLPDFNLTLFGSGGDKGENVVMIIARGDKEYKIVKSDDHEVLKWAEDLFDHYEKQSSEIFESE